MQCKMLTASAFITQAASYFSSLNSQSAQLGIDVTTIFADVATKERNSCKLQGNEHFKFYGYISLAE